jgi:hypothetical protein
VSVVLVDTSVLLDVMTDDPTWAGWSSEALERCGDENELAINPIIYAEVSIRFGRIEDLDAALPETEFRRLPLPFEAGFRGQELRPLSAPRRCSPGPTPGLLHRGARGRIRLGTADARRYALPNLLPTTSGDRSLKERTPVASRGRVGA